MDMSDDIDKSWDHPWTTEEMRKNRREWSLAGDVGLLKHLQQFSENLMSKANKTQAALDTLTTQLKETEILVDNVTNTSLALANTQFIESRVQEDEIEIKENSKEKQEYAKLQDSTPESLLASISESVKQGLSIMDEKYKVMDVACSDSEEEDDGGMVFSVIVGPNDPYQDRPLPYVIGSSKWTASNKIGLESSSSSSSESEQVDEERDESDSEKEKKVQKVFSSRHNPEINIARLSSSSDSDNYNDPSNNVSYMNNSKISTISQNNINSVSESTTPSNISKISNVTAPNFAEELAKRLGTVRQAQKPAVVDEISESSINRYKDDLFVSEKDKDVFNEGTDSLFSDKKGLFDDQVSANLWKEKPIKSYKNNIIPASIDVPPPITTVSTKPKSAIDDLFADADSEEDSDIFLSRNTVKKRTKESSDNSHSANTEDKPKKLLDVVAPGFANIATSTPDYNVKASGLFSDDENDDADLFDNSKKQSHKSPSASLSTNTTQESNRKEPIGGVSLLNSALMSDMESKLSSRIMQRQQESFDSSDSDAPGNSDSTTRSNVGPASSQRNTLSDIIAASENVSAINVNSNNTSGISVQPTSIDNTLGSGLCEPVMSSTRLKSEEIYRERITSDSLFVTRTNQPADVNSANDNAQQPSSRQEEQDIFSLAQQRDSVFENDDLFGPPPLPSKSDSKRAKSKVSSLFDDSDSGDDLFSAASSGSRSQKSTDFFAAASSNDRTKTFPKSGGLFDDDVDIFGGKDALDIDIFGVTSKSRTKNIASDDLFDSHGQDLIAAKNSNAGKGKLQTTRMESKNINLFDDGDDGDDGDLFTVKPMTSKTECKTELFENEDNLFPSTETSNKEYSSLEKDAAVEPKNVSSLEAGKTGKDDFSRGELFTKTTKTRSLLFEEDDYDDLFGTKDAVQRKDNRSKESREEIDKDKVIDQAQKLPEEGKDSLESSSSNLDVKMMTTESNVVIEKSVNEERSKAEFEETFSKEDSATKKNSPPKTLNIRTIPSPPSDDQNNQQAPRKLVSGKIKNLMGKMGDLKILSPMDAPPLWRKSEEKTDEDEDVVDKDGDLSIAGRVSPPSVSENSARKESSYSTISSISNTEIAISFDDLAQVETLSTTASKSRVRIQAKRRPPSRHARKSALRHSGIDFDMIDNADNDNSQEDSHVGTFSSTKDSSTASTNNAIDHLTINDNAQRSIEPSFMDDKSELGSISKESSMSINKNTLLSPSTDEEDLFDVPPDLPEDPQKEDALFGRAPILSPVDSGRSDKTSVTDKTVIRKIDDNDAVSDDKHDFNESTQSDAHSGKSENTEKRDNKRKEMDDEQSEAQIESNKVPCDDPLRDSSHDPLKDPSQLFAFVTKTPSPEKSKLLFTEPDDSLFSSGSARKSSESKKILDLFADDDTGGDLFSAAPLKRTVKKPLRETKIDLFGDDDAQNDDGDSLFGSASNKIKLDNQKSNPTQVGRRRNIFDDDDDDDDSSLFIESSGQSQKSDSASFSEPKHDLADSQTKSTSNLKDIFGDAPCEDDDDDIDLFATKKVIPKKVSAPSKSLFTSDDDEDDDEGSGSHIFCKQSSASIDLKAQLTVTNSRPVVKKSVTRDLKKTAEKIVEDPLSLLQDD